MTTNKLIEDFIEDYVTAYSLRCLDIGGGRNPFPCATHVIDARSREEALGAVPKNVIWETRNFYDLPWPYPDDYFDVSVCIHTLEDLKDPLPVIAEIVRVSKKGYISCPTRALESCPYIIDRNPLEHGMTGYTHHRWFVEIQNGDIVFTNKYHGLYRSKYKIKNVAQKSIHIFWQGDITVKEKYIGGVTSQEQDSLEYKKRHDTWLREKNLDQYISYRWNFPAAPAWQDALMEDYVVGAPVMYHARRIYKHIRNFFG